MDGSYPCLPKRDRRAACPTLPGSGFFNPYAETHTSRRHLPHWRQQDVWYFVTYRLADSLPKHKLGLLEAERQRWIAAHPDPMSDLEVTEYWERFGGRIHDLLDAGSGKCWLRRQDVREVVVESLLYGTGTRYDLAAWVVMPNHVHALVMPMKVSSLSKILHTWKSYTAKQINKLLKRSGTFWQGESYNHIVRNPGAFSKIRDYILSNPSDARLGSHEYSVGQGRRRFNRDPDDRRAACPTLENIQVPTPTDSSPRKVGRAASLSSPSKPTNSSP